MIEVNFERGTREDIKREAYEKGVNDAFDVAHKIESASCNGGYTAEEIYRLFPDRGSNGGLLDRVMAAYSPMAIVTIANNYEVDKKKLHVGDVINKYDIVSIVTKINDLGICYRLYSDGSTAADKDVVDSIKHKTGENMTIPEFLEKYGRIGE